MDYDDPYDDQDNYGKCYEGYDHHKLPAMQKDRNALFGSEERGTGHATYCYQINCAIGFSIKGDRQCG